MRRLLAFCLALCAPPLAAQQMVEVDVELILAVDVSRSMTPDELEIQRRGYAAALSSDAVYGAIRGGMIGNIAVTYVEWAGDRSQTVVMPWTLIDSRDAVEEFARRLTTWNSPGMRRTSISGALLYSAEMFEANRFVGLRRVIDISGDGPNNQGPPVTQARDRVLSQGIIINGLPLMTEDEMSSVWGIPDLDVYYANCVVGGPGAFVVPVFSWDQFAAAVRRKLVLEIAGHAQRPKATIQKAQAYDCLIGEKVWQRNRRNFDLR
ncbi:DUF1194 domain-containing protein [Shimia sp. W99]